MFFVRWARLLRSSLMRFPGSHSLWHSQLQQFSFWQPSRSYSRKNINRHLQSERIKTMRIIQSIALTLVAAVSVSAATPIGGDWQGVIKVQNQDLRLVLHVKEAAG